MDAVAVEKGFAVPDDPVGFTIETESVCITEWDAVEGVKSCCHNSFKSDEGAFVHTEPASGEQTCSANPN